ncbi:conjugal transfer protein TrbL family protein [Halalkalibacter flavus]|uniref:conjugal transfer protein TrbL family protein n=1 Tax=Halalkalibacter flavus TaxID=3090668 RepID=UPI002FCBC60E
MKNLASFRRIATLLTMLIILQAGFNLNISHAEEKQSIIMQDTTINEQQLERELKKEIQNTPTQSREIKPGTEGFYNAYKNEIDSLVDQYEKLHGKGSANLYKKRVKELDYQEGTFNCGRFDVGCHVDSWIFSLGKKTIEYVLSPLSQLAIKPSAVLDDAVLTRFKDSFDKVPQTLLALILIFQILKMMIVRFTDASDAPQILNEKLAKTVFAAALLFTYTPFFKLLLDIQYALNAPIFYQLTGAGHLKTDIMVGFLLTPNGSMMVLYLIIYALVLLALFLQMVYSFCLIAILFVTGPLAIVTMPNDTYNLFSLWLKIYIARALTLFVQGLAVVLSISFLTNFENILSLTKAPFVFATSIGFLIVGLMAPSLLQQFGNSSGSGRMVIASIRTFSRGRR